MNTDIIDRIYEASFVPELWPNVLDDLAEMTESHGGLLFSVRDRVLNWTSSDNLSDVFQAYVADGWFKKCSRRLCMFNEAADAFKIETDFWTDEQIASNPIYRDFFRPHGLGWSAGTGVRTPDGDNIVFSIERSFDRGPIEQDYVSRLNDLRSHLARSALVASRLGLKKATGAAEAMTTIGLPVVLIDIEGKIIHANEHVEKNEDLLHWRVGDRLALSDTQANDLLKSTLDELHLHERPTVRSIPIRNADQKPVYVGHIVPVSRSAQDLFSQGYAVLVFMPLTQTKAPSPEILQSLYDFTESEARIARKLCKGMSAEEIAAANQVSVNTVRTHIRRILEKTGCSRQTEVVALLSQVEI